MPGAQRQAGAWPASAAWPLAAQTILPGDQNLAVSCSQNFLVSVLYSSAL